MPRPLIPRNTKRQKNLSRIPSSVNWFWEFLYGLSKALFQLIDAMVFGAKKLCGLDPITVNGEETDLLSFLFRSDEVGRAFRVAALSGIVVVFLFAVFAIIRSLTSRKNETNPLSVLVQTGKTLLIFLCVPAVILAPNDMDDLCTLYDKAGRINKVEQEQIVGNDRGNAFIITGPSSRNNIRIVASEKMREVFCE